MTDEARIERLTELARRVWPEAGPLVVGVIQFGEGRAVHVYHSGGDEDMATVSHPRALDALEAALCALAGESPGWVEQLAAKWEAMADDGEGGAFRECAGELRKRAKGEPCEAPHGDQP